MKEPYLMNREEWTTEYDSSRVDGMPRYNSNGSGRGETVSKLNKMEYLLFGIGKWIYDSAVNGEEWALECLEYNIYDKYEMVIKKAKEENLI